MATITDSELFTRIRSLLVYADGGEFRAGIDPELARAIDARIAKSLLKPKARKQAASLEPLSDERRAAMSDAEIYAYYKRIAHIEAVRFTIKYAIVDDMPADLAAAWRELLAEAEGGLNRSQTYRRLWSLTERWTVIKADRERIERPDGPNFSDWAARALAAGVPGANGGTSLQDIENAERQQAHARAKGRAA